MGAGPGAHIRRPPGIEPPGMKPPGIEPLGMKPPGIEPPGMEPPGMKEPRTIRAGFFHCQSQPTRRLPIHEASSERRLRVLVVSSGIPGPMVVATVPLRT